MTDISIAQLDEQGWTPLALSWVRLQPSWAPLEAPIVISLAEVELYGFAAVSSPLPVGEWTVRLRLGATSGAMCLATCDPNGQRREHRSEQFPVGDGGIVLSDIAVPADFTDMCLVIQKRQDGPGGVAVLGVDIRKSSATG